MTLHQLNTASMALFTQSLRFSKPEDCFLFYEDAVYTLLHKQAEPIFTESIHTFYAIKEDVLARGISQQVPKTVTLISYNDWVDLTTEYNSIAWH